MVLHQRRWWLLAVPLLVTTAGADSMGTVIAGQDPHAFRTAADMYQVAPTLPWDPSAGELVKQVTAKLRGGTDPAQSVVRQLLLRLEPYRREEQVQGVVASWAQAAAAHKDFRKRASLSGLPSARVADGMYRQGQFEQAVQRYAIALSVDRANVDVRSNLALAELHLGHDLTAELQLELLRRVKPYYLPAIVNMTVVCERLGQTDRAAVLAQRSVATQARNGPAAFNAAWYREQAGDVSGARQILSTAGIGGLGGKYGRYAALLKHAETGEGFFWSQGLAGRWGARRSVAGRVVAVVLYGISLLFVAAFAVAAAAQHYEPASGFFTGLTLAAIGYLIVWGAPIGWGWAGFAAVSLGLGVVGTFGSK